MHADRELSVQCRISPRAQNRHVFLIFIITAKTTLYDTSNAPISSYHSHNQNEWWGKCQGSNSSCVGSVTQGSMALQLLFVICNTPPTVKILSPREQSHDMRSAMPQNFITRSREDTLDEVACQPCLSSRLHIPAGILRIPVFSVPIACFSQESQFSFRSNLVYRKKKEQKPSQ